MKQAQAHRDLLEMGAPIVTTAEATALWRTTSRTATRRLRGLEEAGFVRHLRRGLWALDVDVDPLVVPPYLTAPLSAYVSFASALRHHGLIEQIPRRFTVASLQRAQMVETSVGTYDIRHLAPEVFGGFTGSAREGYMAGPEKAIFDTVYVRAAAGSHAHFPELTLPAGFDRGVLDHWLARITSARLRTIVARDLDAGLEHARRELEPAG